MQCTMVGESRGRSMKLLILWCFEEWMVIDLDTD